MLPEVKATLCQFCIDRQLEPNEAIGIYEKQPICSVCLDAYMENQLLVGNPIPEQTEDKKQLALKLLDAFEELCEKWPLKGEESLINHEDFYNHRPPAIINLSLTEIQEIYSRRQSILFAIKHKDMHWYTKVEEMKRSAREQANLTGLAKSVKEKSKILRPTSDITLEKE